MADPISEMLTQPHGWVILAGAGMAIGMWITYSMLNKDEKYESTKLEDVAFENIYKAIEEQGDKLHKKLRKGMVTIGVIRKADKIYTDEEPLRQITQDDVENDTQENRAYVRFIIYPDTLGAKIISRIKGIRKRIEKVFIIPRVYLDYRDQIELMHFVELHEIGGVWLARNCKSAKPVEDQAITELLKDNLERDINWIKWMNWKERRFGEDMQMQEKINELKRAYWESREDQAVENA